MGTDWILFALLGLLWLATGGIPLQALWRRHQPSATKEPTTEIEDRR